MNNLHSEVTNRIMTALERRSSSEERPWQNNIVLPSNVFTGKPYRGINVLMLSIAAQERHYSDHRWLTFKQAHELGVLIRKGEQGTSIFFYRRPERTESSAPRSIPLLTSYIVFNVRQLESIPECYALRPLQRGSPIATVERLLQQSGAAIRHEGCQAFYRPRQDCIQLPSPERFNHPADYYATALHELCHWTSHPSRLNRVLGRQHDIEAYAYEELIAELGSAFLCAHCGLHGHLEHARYTDLWLDALRRNKRLIFVAAGAAQKAADFVLALADSDATLKREER